MTELVRVEDLKSFLTSLSAHDKRVIANRSYVHPNGFVKITLQSLSSGATTRLHVWNTEGFVQNPHNHGWNFTSYILQGQLTDTHYTIDEGENGSNHREYIMDLSRKDHSIHVVHTRDVYLQIVGTYERKSGTNYTLDSEVIHTSYPAPGTVTFVQQQPHCKDHNRVFMPFDHPNPETLTEHTRYPSISVDVLDTILTDITSL